MESNNISTKIVSILIPLIIVLVVLVPITNTVSGGGGEGPQTITQEGAFMKEIKLADLDKSQEYVLADINEHNYVDGQLVFYGGMDESGYANYAVYHNNWNIPNEDLNSVTGIGAHEWSNERLFLDYGADSMLVDVSSNEISSSQFIQDSLVLSYDSTWLMWHVQMGPTTYMEIITDSIFVASDEVTEYIGVCSDDYNNQYYIDSNSKFYVGTGFGYINEAVEQDLGYFGIYDNNTLTEIDTNLYYIDSTEYDGIYDGLNYAELTPFDVSIENSKVTIIPWEFTISGTKIDFHDFTQFVGVIPRTIEIQDEGNGISGPAGTLIQMIPIFAILGILSALIVPMIRKEESI